jgi:hypothetical protein
MDMHQGRISNGERLVDTIDERDFPILTGLLRTDLGESARHELIALLERRFQARAPRRPVHVKARLFGTNIDQVVVVRDISASGLRMAIEKGVPFPRRPGDVWVRLATVDGLLELPLAFVRVVMSHRGEFEAAFQFERISALQVASLENLRDLFEYKP